MPMKTLRAARGSLWRWSIYGGNKSVGADMHYADFILSLNCQLLKCRNRFLMTCDSSLPKWRAIWQNFEYVVLSVHWKNLAYRDRAKMFDFGHPFRRQP